MTTKKYHNKYLLYISFQILLSFLPFCHAYADQVDDFIRAKMRDAHIPGMQIAVIQNGKIIKSANYGLASLQYSVPVNNDTVFNLASMTKAFTSVAVMQLVEQGRLTLSNKISNYLSDLPKSWQDITLHQLLSHTSGLPDVMNQHFQLINSDGEQASWQELQHRPFHFAPGSQFHYNQTNYWLVGEIIKQVSGQSYAELISQKQLNKVKMPKTQAAGFAHFYYVTENQAQDYRVNPEGKITNVLTHFPASIRAGAGMNSNAMELANWVTHLQQGKFFNNPSSLNTLWRPYPLEASETKTSKMHPYALGWYKVDRDTNPKMVTAGGGQSALVVYPEDNLSIVVLTNLAGSTPEYFIDEIAEYYIEDFGLSKATQQLKKALDKQGYSNALSIAAQLQKTQGINYQANELNHLGNLLTKQQRKTPATNIFELNNQLFSKVKISEQVWKDYLGHYELADFAIDVTHQGNALFITATGDKRLAIFAQSETEFILKTVDASISFIREQNKITGLVLTLNGEKLAGKKQVND